MKKDIHPEYYDKVKVICACGNSFETGSTVKKMNLDVCGACHPFYTGQQKIMDNAGRVDRFKKKIQQATDRQAQAKKKPRKNKQTETTEK